MARLINSTPKSKGNFCSKFLRLHSSLILQINNYFQLEVNVKMTMTVRLITAQKMSHLSSVINELFNMGWSNKAVKNLQGYVPFKFRHVCPLLIIKTGLVVRECKKLERLRGI